MLAAQKGDGNLLAGDEVSRLREDFSHNVEKNKILP